MNFPCSRQFSQLAMVIDEKDGLVGAKDFFLPMSLIIL